MINLKTDCNTCIHSEICKKKDTPDYVREKIDDMVSKRIVLDELYRKIYHEPEGNIGVLRVK